MKYALLSLLALMGQNLGAQDVSEYDCPTYHRFQAKPLSIQFCYKKTGDLTEVAYVVDHDLYKEKPEIWKRNLMFRMYFKPKCGDEFVQSPVPHTVGNELIQRQRGLQGAIGSPIQIIKPNQKILIPMRDFFKAGYCQNQYLTGYVLGFLGTRWTGKLTHTPQ